MHLFLPSAETCLPCGGCRFPQKGNNTLRKLGRIFFTLICLSLLVCSASDLIPDTHAASAMTASESCVAFIKKIETFSSKPYYDYGQHTVGYGTKCPTDKYLEYYNNGIPIEEAEALLQETLTEVAESINKKLIDPYHIALSQHQFDALVSFSFNVGTSWMTYDSTLRSALLETADEDALVYAFSLYSTAGGNYLTGLINRRLCEANMFLNGVYSQKAGNAYGYVLYEPNGGSLTYGVQGFLCESRPAPVADAVRNGDVFVGWYTDLSGGLQVQELSSELSGKTLFARWQSSEDYEAHDSPSLTIRVTGDVVNIRKGPGTNYGIAKQVYRDDVLLVSHVSELSGRKWGKVNDGWICLEYTNYDDLVNGSGNDDAEDTAPTDPPLQNEEETNDKIAPDHQENVIGTVRVNDLLRIRSGPGTTYATVGYLSDGQKVEILGQKAAESMIWGKIDRGWVSMDYVVTETPSSDNSPEPNPDDIQENENRMESSITADRIEVTAIEGVITADALRIRSGPGTDYRILGFYYQDDPVTVLQTKTVDSALWGKTKLGWINMDYVSTDSARDISSDSAAEMTMTVIADCLRVRKKTRADSKIAALLYYGDKVTVLETVTVDGTVWGRINQGWICMDYVE